MTNEGRKIIKEWKTLYKVGIHDEETLPLEGLAKIINAHLDLYKKAGTKLLDCPHEPRCAHCCAPLARLVYPS